MAQDTVCICVLIGTAICKSGECNKKNALLWEQEQGKEEMLGVRLQVANKIAKKLQKKYDNYLAPYGIFRKVRKRCSCWMCGNPRKWSGEKTRQEKLAAIDME